MVRPKILITGAFGFVGQHLLSHLESRHPDTTRIATGLEVSPSDGADASVLECKLDILDQGNIRDVLTLHRPTHVIHLAGIAAPNQANSDQSLAWRTNVEGTLNLANAIMELLPDCWLLSVGSGLVYGGTARFVNPLTEDSVLEPWDMYGVTKAAADLALGAMARRGLQCLRFRPFNHTGPHQTTDFAIPAFASQLARIEAGNQEPTVYVGNLDAERDFLDVKDVVRAYANAVFLTHQLSSGTIFNLASGVPRPMREILQSLITLSGLDVDVVKDPDRQRPSEIPSMVGSNQKARDLLQWSPTQPFEQTLSDVLNSYREQNIKRA